MDNYEIGQLATDTLPWVGVQITCAGILTGDTNAGRLGSELLILATEVPAFQKNDTILGKLTAILKLVDKACSKTTTSSRGTSGTLPDQALGILRKVTSLKEFNPQYSSVTRVRMEIDIQRCLRHFLMNKLEVQTLLNMIQEYRLLNIMEPHGQKANNELEASETDPSCSSHVHDLLYSQMNMHASCACESRHLRKARLRLERDIIGYRQDCIPFELLFEPRRTGTSGVIWQETKILVPRHGMNSKDRPRKKARFRVDGDAPGSSTPESATVSESLRRLRPGDLCRYVGGNGDVQLCYKIRGGALNLVEGTAERAQRRLRAPQEVLSLSDLLSRTRSALPKSIRVQIACTIAKSVWQYYNSSWMSTPWTHDDIHFLEERIAGTHSYRPHPYFSVRFGSRQKEKADFYSSPDLAYNYPHVLALGMLLIELATGVPFTEEEYSGQWDEAHINDYFILAWQAAAQSGLGGSFGGDSFYDILQTCLDTDMFHDAPYDDDNPKRNLETRQSILYNKVVLPLQRLDDAYKGHWELPDTDEFLSLSIHRSNARSFKKEECPADNNYLNQISDPTFLGSGDIGTKGWTAQHWLKQIDNINAGLTLLHRSTPAATPIKIAILDTGCDMDAEFFSTFTDDEDRLNADHWYDWVANKPQPVDDHGHGTSLVTLMLRMVRNAEIFVARVAKNSEGLKYAEKNISKAIVYAAEKWDVDIISMSFGFPTEIACIKSAIRKAEDIKDSKLVIFAAAANDGSNTHEMFPASMESVISVRATDSNGSFVGAYNPPPSAMKEDSRLYGTLGDNVPYDWSNGLLTKSGCSLATPVMAAITTLMMEYYSYKAESFEDNGTVLEQIKTQRGVIQLFRAIAVEKETKRYYVAPWDLFSKKEADRVAIARVAIGRLPAQQNRSL